MSFTMFGQTDNQMLFTWFRCTNTPDEILDHIYVKTKYIYFRETPLIPGSVFHTRLLEYVADSITLYWVDSEPCIVLQTKSQSTKALELATHFLQQWLQHTEYKTTDIQSCRVIRKRLRLNEHVAYKSSRWTLPRTVYPQFLDQFPKWSVIMPQTWFDAVRKEMSKHIVPVLVNIVFNFLT